jgi:hypothetical protein
MTIRDLLCVSFGCFIYNGIQCLATLFFSGWSWFGFTGLALSIFFCAYAVLTARHECSQNKLTFKSLIGL